MKKYIVIFMLSVLALSADCNNVILFLVWHVAFLIPLIWSGMKLIEEGEKC